MEKIIKELYSLNRVLVGEDEDEAIGIVSKYIPIKLIKIPSGTKCFTWTVPDKWKVVSAKLTDITKRKIIIDYKDNPLHLYVGSLPFEGEVSFEELNKHLRYKCLLSKDKDAIPYVFKYYDTDWGFCLSQNQYKKINKKSKFRVSIKTSYQKGFLTIGEATISGKIKDEILVIAHLDHPFQANDNLSGVAVAIQLFNELNKEKHKFTIKFLFLPETIGSIAYVWNRRNDLSKIKAVLVMDVVGNKNRVLIQKTFDEKNLLNYLTKSACQNLGLEYELAEFRNSIGSDELIFSDPKFKMPAIMITTWPYDEYHTHFDTPKIIDYNTLNGVKDIMLKVVRNFDRNYIPKRKWSGPLMRSKIGWFLGKQPEDRQLEIFGYKIDGIKSVIEIAEELNMDTDLAFDYIEALVKYGLVDFNG